MYIPNTTHFTLGRNLIQRLKEILIWQNGNNNLKVLLSLGGRGGGWRIEFFPLPYCQYWMQHLFASSWSLFSFSRQDECTKPHLSKSYAGLLLSSPWRHLWMQFKSSATQYSFPSRYSVSFWNWLQGRQLKVTFREFNSIGSVEVFSFMSAVGSREDACLLCFALNL